MQKSILILTTRAGGLLGLGRSRCLSPVTAMSAPATETVYSVVVRFALDEQDNSRYD